MYISKTPINTPINFNGSPKKAETKPAQNTSNRMIIGTLMALASLNPINATPNENDSTQIVVEYADDYDDDEVYKSEAETVRFNDENGILEESDFEYSSPEAKKNAQYYLKGLKPFIGKKNTQATDDMAKHLVYLFNRCSNYSYDLKSDENVKDAEAFIKYDKTGRIISTKLKSSFGFEQVVNFKYYKNGNIDRATYEGDKIIEYRKNGSRFSLETIDDYRSRELIYYSQEGKKTFQSTESPNSLTEYTFDKDGAVIKYFYKDNNSGIQKIFNEGDPVLITQYDGNGCFKEYTDNYFEKDGVDIDAEGYMGKSVKAHINHKYNLLYKAAPLSGKILSPVRQGTTGTCYIAGIVNSMVKTIEGRALLDATLPSDDNTKECVVDFKGLKKKYVFPAEVVSLNMSRLGRRSADYSGMVMAFEKFRESNVSREEYPNLPSDFFRDKRGSNDRRVDSGYPTEFFYALTGKEMKQSGDRITDNDILNARKCLDTGRGVVNAGTIMKTDKNNEIPLEDRAEGITPAHNMAVWKISQNSVTLYDSVTENEIVYPIDKFKKYFSKLYWATLD